MLLITLLVVSPLEAQKRRDEPKRPELPAGTDVNDPVAYYRHGMSRLERAPKEAAAAFYWASRLDPERPELLYAQRVAHLISEPRRLYNYMLGVRRVVRSKEIRALDSLYYRALMLDPYMYRQFDRLLFDRFIAAWIEEVERGRSPGTLDRALLEYHMNNYLRSAGAGMKAWLAYGERRFQDALRLYEQALEKEDNKADIHANRARIFYLIGNFAAAREEMGRAVEELRKEDEDALVFFYESKALYEHSIGMACEREGDIACAREAYGRALLEDLSYHPAHVRLAMLALAENDTATALGELDLAVEIAGENAVIRTAYGATLLGAGRLEEAAEQLEKAIELEPYYAHPYLLLGRALDGQGRGEAALAQYRAFLERASRRHEAIAQTTQRVRELEAQLAGDPGDDA